MAVATPADLRGVERLSIRLHATLEHLVELVSQSSTRQRFVSERKRVISALLLLVLEGRSLARYDATLTEALCGLQRKTKPSGSKLLDFQKFIALLSMTLIRLVSPPSEIAAKISKGILPSYAHGQLQQSFPILQAITKGVFFAYEFLFLFKVIKVPSPMFHARQWQVLRGFKWHKVPIKGENFVLRRSSFKVNLLHQVVDTLQLLIILSLFYSQYKEWLIGQKKGKERHKKDRINQHFVYPKPPPPHLSKMQNIDTKVCLICNTEKKEPALCVDCGFLFCKACIEGYVKEAKKCPITNATMRFKRDISKFTTHDGFLMPIQLKK
ncbi:hypothetical protein GOP47_0004883 [Adiantum capillus-veneris]|uniref:Peroxin-12 n=1 Tax=Adiantum capillus-veneris TaxID=13818 RepID=A0A9D4ZL21_ADICA|nr:hypothetical protein GOP47_0004883 [Adiantum capillus-veneris]